MKQSKSYILLIAVLSVLLSDSATAQSRMKIPAPDLINWSDEKLDQWEDSVKNVLYPTPETKQRLATDDKNEDVKNNPAVGGTTTSPANAMPLSVSID